MLKYNSKFLFVVCSTKTRHWYNSSGCFICMISSIAVSSFMHQKLAKGYIVVYSEN